jgi:nucleotide-binding universal stress UspA family protein
MDFSPASIRAVQLALLIIEDCGTLTLVHVRPANDLSSAQHTARSARTSDEIADRFTRLAVQLRDFAPPGVVIETQMESGEVVDQVLSVAREVDAQLIAIGVHAARMRNRIVDYGFAADTLRRASCSVLASPATRVARVFRDDNESHYWTTAPDESESESVVPG